MQKRFLGYAGEDVLNGLWLSPLPVAQDCMVAGTHLPHIKTTTTLSLTRGEVYSYTEFYKMIKTCVYVGYGVCLLGLIVGMPQLDNILDKILLFLICVALPFGFFLLLCPFLLFSRHLAKNDLPVHLHRQRREVLFLRRKKGKTEYLIIPWEEILATTRTIFQFNPFGGYNRAHLTLGAEDPANPGKWWCKKKFITLHNAHSRLQWGQICRFMDAGPDHFWTDEENFIETYSMAPKYWYPIPEFVNEWIQPIPEEQWKKPSTKLLWYNAWLISYYRFAGSFLDLGWIESKVIYPGDEEAAKQLELGILTPLYNEGGREFPSLPAQDHPPAIYGSSP